RRAEGGRTYSSKGRKGRAPPSTQPHGHCLGGVVFAPLGLPDWLSRVQRRQLAHSRAPPAVHPRTDGLGAHGCRRAVAFERLPSGHVGADVFRKTLPVMPRNRLAGVTEL